MKRTKVHDVMTTDVVSVRVDTSFSEVVATLVTNRVTAVPVLDSTGSVLGVVSDADLVIKEADLEAPGHARLIETHRRRRQRRKAGAVNAGEVMSTPARTIWPAATVDDAARVMAENQIRRLPVIDPLDGHLVGIVSRSDLLCVYLRSDEGIEEDIRDGVLPQVTDRSPLGFTIAVHHGFVAITGQVEFRSSVHAVESAVARVEGVVGIDTQLTYQQDDHILSPNTPR